MAGLTHFNSRGEARMVDVGDKPATRRVAVAEGFIRMQPETLALIQSGSAKKGDVIGIARIAVAEGYIRMQAETLALIAGGGHKKGDVLGVARVAGIMAAKKTAELVPLCHPLSLSKVEIDLATVEDDDSVYCQATVETTGPTGVEMEALMAVQVSLLTVYDMCKAVDRGMSIGPVQLKEKSGGRSGAWKRG